MTPTNCDKCTEVITYKAPDGKTFDSKEECEAYINRTVIYVIIYNGIYTNFSLHTAYIDKAKANEVVDYLNEAYESERYQIVELELNTDIIPDTLHAKITNQTTRTSNLGWVTKFFNINSRGE